MSKKLIAKELLKGNTILARGYLTSVRLEMQSRELAEINITIRGPLEEIGFNSDDVAASGKVFLITDD